MNATGDRISRLLTLVPYLLARPGVDVIRVATDFGVTEAELRRDLDLLWVCGLPGHGPGDLIDLSFDGDTITVTYDAGMSRPLRLTSDEALALTVALQTLADTPGLADGDAVARALAKIETAAGEPEGASRVAVAVESPDEALTVVRRALQDGRALHLVYYSAGRDETTERDVDPMRLLVAEGRGYLEAWCRQAEAVRLFRIDRIDDVTIRDEPSAPPALAQQRDLDAGLFQVAPEHGSATLRLAASQRWVADYYPCEHVEEAPDGTLVATLRFTDAIWIRQLVLGGGPDVQVLEPSWLAEEIRAEARAALAAYDDA